MNTLILSRVPQFLFALMVLSAVSALAAPVSWANPNSPLQIDVRGVVDTRLRLVLTNDGCHNALTAAVVTERKADNTLNWLQPAGEDSQQLGVFPAPYSSGSWTAALYLVDNDGNFSLLHASTCKTYHLETMNTTETYQVQDYAYTIEFIGHGDSALAQRASVQVYDRHQQASCPAVGSTEEGTYKATAWSLTPQEYPRRAGEDTLVVGTYVEINGANHLVGGSCQVVAPFGLEENFQYDPLPYLEAGYPGVMQVMPANVAEEITPNYAEYVQVVISGADLDGCPQQLDPNQIPETQTLTVWPVPPAVEADSGSVIQPDLHPLSPGYYVYGTYRMVNDADWRLEPNSCQADPQYMEVNGNMGMRPVISTVSTTEMPVAADPMQFRFLKPTALGMVMLRLNMPQSVEARPQLMADLLTGYVARNGVSGLWGSGVHLAVQLPVYLEADALTGSVDGQTAILPGTPPFFGGGAGGFVGMRYQNGGAITARASLGTLTGLGPVEAVCGYSSGTVTCSEPGSGSMPFMVPMAFKLTPMVRLQFEVKVANKGNLVFNLLAGYQFVDIGAIPPDATATVWFDGVPEQAAVSMPKGLTPNGGQLGLGFGWHFK